MNKIGHYSGFTEANGLGFTSGVVGSGPNGHIVNGAYDQTKVAISNLIQLLNTRNLALDSVVKTTVYITNNADYDAMNRAYGEAFGDILPARSTVIVAGLPRVESDGPEPILVEFDAIVALS
jgi:2-iminobutanoate/2-iminopropanoate deaminase